jgi:hypothetical protein
MASAGTTQSNDDDRPPLRSPITFLTIPAEIRKLIYESLFKDVVLFATEESEEKPSRIPSPTTAFNILAVCKSINSEASDLLFRTATVKFSNFGVARPWLFRPQSPKAISRYPNISKRQRHLMTSLILADSKLTGMRDVFFFTPKLQKLTVVMSQQPIDLDRVPLRSAAVSHESDLKQYTLAFFEGKPSKRAEINDLYGNFEKVWLSSLVPLAEFMHILDRRPNEHKIAFRLCAEYWSDFRQTFKVVGIPKCPNSAVLLIR